MGKIVKMIADIVIKSKNAIEAMSKKILRNLGGKAISVEISNDEVNLCTIPVPGSGLTALLKKAKANVKVGGNTSKMVSNFLKDIMYVQFVGEGESSGLQRIDLIFNGIYVKHDSRDTELFVKLEENKFFNLLNGDKKSIDTKEYLLMIPIGATPSMLRKKQMLMGNKSLPWFNIINRLSYGALAINNGIEGVMSDLHKLFTRMFHLWAPHKIVGKANSFGFYNGIWKNPKGNAAWDGMNFISVRAFCKWMSEVLNVNEVLINSVLGKAVQCRPDTNKAFGSIVTDAFISRIIENNNCPVFRFTKEEFNSALQKDIWNSPKYKDAWIIVGNGIPDYISDRNCLKTPFDLKEGGNMAVLAFAKYSKSNTSMQALSKIAAGASREKLEELIGYLFNNYIDTTLDSIKNKKPGIVSIKEAKSNYLLGIIDKIAPAYIANKDQQLYKSAIDTLAKSGMKASKNLKFSIDGGSLSLFSDICELIGAPRVLKYGEIFSPYANKYFAKGSGLCTLFKYPSMGAREFYQCKSVTLDEIKRRVDKFKVSTEVKRLIVEWYSMLSDGLLVVPAIEELKNLLAGMDFDFDGVTMILDRKFNEVMSTIKPLIVNIDPGKAEPSLEKLTLGFENFHKVLKLMFNVEGKSVGQITRMCETVFSLINVPFEEAKKRILEMVKSKSNGSCEFLPLPGGVTDIDGHMIDHVNISPEIVSQFVYNLKRTKITEDNYKQILMDIICIFRYYQEITIDSVKTGITAKIAFDMKKFVTSSTIKISHEFNKEGEMVVTTKAPDENDKRELIEDVLHKMRIKCAKGVATRINELLNEKPRYNEEDLAMFQGALQGRTSLRQSLIQIKLMYNDLTGSYVNLSNQYDKSGREKDLIKQEHNEIISSLANMVRRLTSNLTSVDRALVVKAIAMQNYKGSRSDGGNKFASIIMPEYIKMISEKFGEVGLAGSEIVGEYKDGDSVEFKNGEAEKAISINEPITGKFTVKIIDKKMYATQPITKAVRVPKIDNTQLVFKLHSSASSDLDAICKKIEEAKKVVLTANKNDKDRVKDLNGNVLAPLSCDIGAFDLARLYNGVVGEVAGVKICTFNDKRGASMRTAFVTLNNIGEATPIDDEDLEYYEYEDMIEDDSLFEGLDL